MRYFAHISYNGYRYRGWQNQATAISVQETVERAFQQIFGCRIICHGCGRTDAMVHASSYYFHFDIKEPIEEKLSYQLNKILPNDIAIHEIFAVNSNCDAQHSAIQRTYTYRIHTKKNPFIAHISSYYELDSINIEQMQEAVLLLPKYHNYYNFCQAPTHQDNFIVDVKDARLSTSNSSTELFFTITANRFLQGMIRIIVYRLLQVGSNQMSIGVFETLLKGLPSNLPIRKAYPQGLSLTDIKYNFDRVKSVGRKKNM